MTTPSLAEFELKFNAEEQTAIGPSPLKLAKMQYEIIDKALHSLAGLNGTETKDNSADKTQNVASEDDLHHFKARILELAAASPCLAKPDLAAKIELLKYVSETESCFEEYSFEGQLFESIYQDSISLLL